nr:amidohydrolase family protein [Gemmatimonadota bacterium]NIR79491.1 amidohydrolase family protein [Gemmatimonadota bacterium]NIT86849.1 amidohydrolase family protein [Gemmatimonadota bacterium]NIU30717.1 amidohydrolase family protein [Gemmatimonadota bacterium]NIV61077.1 amidohydrolase family protein [Gemmatimonadota bacterium]
MRAESRHCGCAQSAGRSVAMAAALTVLPAVLGAQPQPEHPDRPAHYAIRNARIVPVSAPPIENGTVVLSDGVIAAVGRDVEIPPEAWVIDGQGLSVYPGLIDALSGLGLGAEGAPGGSRGRGGEVAASAGEGGGYSWGPEDRPATTPWRSAAESFDASGDEVGRWRDGGFTTVVAVPGTGFVSGRASVMNLGRGEADALVVKTPVAIRLNLEGGAGHEGYPESLMGVFAYFEQLFADAERYDRAWNLYEAGPRGRERPEFDAALEPIRDAVGADRPFLFPGDDPTEIRRALRTGAEAGFRVLVYGARRAYEEPELLRGSDVLVSLEWPETPENGDPEADPVLSELRYRWYAPSTPASLEEADVRFAFYSGDLEGPAEVAAAVRTAIRAGLSREAALRALTLAPAQIYGVADRLGSLEPGKTANVVVTDGVLFTDGAEVKIVFVDGRKYEVRGSAEVLAGRGAGGEGSGGEGEGPEPAWEPVPRAADRGPYAEPDVLVIRNATVHTVRGGTLEDASVLVRDGKIADVGADVGAPSGATVLDGAGMHVTPGIIDAHSHIAAAAINEGSVAVSSMVGIRDVLDPDDESIYRAAAGGVTTANVLHGSASPIGGRNAVVKMRWGADAPRLLFEGAPAG